MNVMRTLTISALAVMLLAQQPLSRSPTASAGATPAVRQVDAVMPLRMAYREIGLAEALGASGRYLESARAHYRAGLAANGTDARRAAGEARVAGDLARIALRRTSAPVPHDLPAPPAAKARGADGGPMQGRSSAEARRPGGPAGRRPGFGGPRRGGFRGHAGVDPVALAELAKRDQSPEVKQLITDALAAQNAAQQAAIAGNVEEARRQMRVGGALAHAAHDLVFANVRPLSRTRCNTLAHPPTTGTVRAASFRRPTRASGGHRRT